MKTKGRKQETGQMMKLFFSKFGIESDPCSFLCALADRKTYPDHALIPELHIFTSE